MSKQLMRKVKALWSLIWRQEIRKYDKRLLIKELLLTVYFSIFIVIILLASQDTVKEYIRLLKLTDVSKYLLIGICSAIIIDILYKSIFKHHARSFQAYITTKPINNLNTIQILLFEELLTPGNYRWGLLAAVTTALSSTSTLNAVGFSIIYFIVPIADTISLYVIVRSNGFLKKTGNILLLLGVIILISIISLLLIEFAKCSFSIILLPIVILWLIGACLLFLRQRYYSKEGSEAHHEGTDYSLSPLHREWLNVWRPKRFRRNFISTICCSTLMCLQFLQNAQETTWQKYCYILIILTIPSCSILSLNVESTYYAGLMTKPVKISSLFRAKFKLALIITTFVTLILMLFAVYYQHISYIFILSSSIYVVGVIDISTLYLSTNAKKVSLDSKVSTKNERSNFNWAILLILFIPFIVFFMVHLIPVHEYVCDIIVAVIGIMILTQFNRIMDFYDRVYEINKYQMISRFK